MADNRLAPLVELPGDEVPVISIWYLPGWSEPGATPVPPMKVIQAVWKDGRVVWSADKKRGEPPYRLGRIEPALLNSVLEELEARGLFSGRIKDPGAIPLETSCFLLAVKDDRRKIRLGYPQEFIAQARKLDEGYLREFEGIWSELVNVLEKLIPKTSQIVREDIPRLAWTRNP